MKVERICKNSILKVLVPDICVRLTQQELYRMLGGGRIDITNIGEGIDLCIGLQLDNQTKNEEG